MLTPKELHEIRLHRALPSKKIRRFTTENNLGIKPIDVLKKMCASYREELRLNANAKTSQDGSEC